LRLSGFGIAFLAGVLLAGCAGQPLHFRDEAALTLERLKVDGGNNIMPSEFRSVQETLGKGDALLKQGERDEADRYYRLTLMKGRLLQQEVDEYKARQLEAQRLAEEQKKAELERQAEEEANRLAQAKVEVVEQKESEVARPKPRPAKEHLLLLSYTVRRGESLPLIASQPEVYGDRNLWPLIYRANRDQIRDPRHIWPGQVLRIPRNNSRDEIGEARRYAQERALR
jgi:hypothetical protein